MPAVDDPRTIGSHTTQSPAASPGGSASGATSGIRRDAPFYNTQAIANKGVDYSTGTRVYRGYLQEYWRGASPPLVANQYRLYFYYNPNSISVNWELDDGQVDNPEYMSGSTGVDRFIGTQVSWDMFFDRVAEVNVIPEGVLQDVRIFDKIVTNGAVGPNGYDVTATSPPFVRVQFSRNGGGVQPPLGYVGALIASSINYTQFDIDMIPTRCVISCTMRCFVFSPEITALDDPNQGAGGTAGYTTPKFALGSKLAPFETVTAGRARQWYQPGAGTRKAIDFGSPVGTNPLSQLNASIDPTTGVGTGYAAPTTRPTLGNGTGSGNQR